MVDWFRLKHSIRLLFILSPTGRADYIRKNKLFRHMGNNCMVMFRKLPLYPQLIYFGNNVRIASNVTFITHDAIHNMLNIKTKTHEFKEHIGCIKIDDNVFIGANSIILPNVNIGKNTIVAAGSVVNRDIGEGVFGGVPAKFLCSIDEFMIKRKTILKNNICDHELPNADMSMVWANFYERRLDCETETKS